MGTEIERKFLVTGEGWKTSAGVEFRQGYIFSSPEATVRVRVAGGKGFLTIKGRTEGFSRAEFEYSIPKEDAGEMLEKLCKKPVIEKKRYEAEWKGRIWEVDEFFGENEGLVVAEVELEDANETVELPPWIGLEVTEDLRYQNACLAVNPFKSWRDSAP